MLHVQQQRSGGVADFGGKFSRESKSYVILGEQNLCGAGVVPRLVITEPKDFGSRESGERRIRDQLNQLFASARGRLNLFALARGPLIVPAAIAGRIT